MTVTQATSPSAVDSGLLRTCLLIIMGSVALRPSFASLTWSQLMSLGLPGC